MTFADRNALFLRTAMEVLREADAPLPRGDVIAAVANRLTLTTDETQVDDRGRPRWGVQFGFRTAEAVSVGWLTKRGGWAVTEAGLQALAEFPGAELLTELRRKYRAAKQLAAGRSKFADPRWTVVAQALALTEPGMWTTYGDLAELTGLSAQSVGNFVASESVENAHRVLRADGTVAPGFRWTDIERTDDPQQFLEREGLEFDTDRRADPAARMTAADFRALFGDLEPDESAIRRAWLIRGSSVDGHDLVPVWLHRNSVSLAASNLREITPPVPRTDLKSIVDADYQHKSYSVRENKVAEFDAFCNRMRPGDYVLTTSQGKAYVGRIDGDAKFVQSSDQRSNLRRETAWLNPTQPVPYANLPEPLPAKLGSQSDVVELTEDIVAIEKLLAALAIRVTEPAPAPQKELAFPSITDELADDLLISRDWLQRQANLLWDRRQLIFYGPPGTGKTYIARELAKHLADPSAVKLVQFHPSYTYEDFFEGFRPVQRDDGRLVFELRPGPFRQLVDAARQHPSDPYLLIIDEINRANLAKVFGELYFLLEYRNDAIGLLYSSDREFTLPRNVFVIGTMNTTDRSIALVDAAMRRRFAFVELHPEKEPTKGLLPAWLKRHAETEPIQYHDDAHAVLDELNSRIPERDLAIGPSYLMRAEIYRDPDGLARVWETSILPLLEEHHYGSAPEIIDQYRLDALRKALDKGQAGDSP